MNALRNSVRLIGHLGDNPKMRKLDSEKSVANFSLATNETYLGKEIKVVKIKKSEYQDTIDFSGETISDWKTLMKTAESAAKPYQKKRKKR